MLATQSMWNTYNMSNKSHFPLMKSTLLLIYSIHIAISQIKRENSETRQSTRSYIETMYRSGNSFKYDLMSTHQGSHKFKLGELEMRTKEMNSNMNQHKNSIDAFRIQVQNMRREFDEEYKDIRQDITEEIDDFQMKFSMEMNKQKKKNLEINQDMDDLKNELLKSKNLLVELLQRTKSLQLRIDGDNVN